MAYETLQRNRQKKPKQNEHINHKELSKKEDVE